MLNIPIRRTPMLALALFALPSALAGQAVFVEASPSWSAAPSPPARQAASAALRGPVAAPVGFDRRVARPEATVLTTDVAAAVAPPREGTPIALMVVGGAALLAGLLIEGNAGRAVAIGGAVLGLTGLFLYLR